MEFFVSIQGEGFHAGRSANFIRLGGCDVGCHWCDVKESWEAAEHPKMSIAEISGLFDFQKGITVVTGGEPAMYDLENLTFSIRNHGGILHIETSGAYELTGDWDWVCVSPKKFKQAQPQNLALADELKVVVFHPSDIKWAQSFLPYLKKECKLYLQPEWSKREKVTPLIIEFCNQNPEWQISLQTHKYLGVR